MTKATQFSAQDIIVYGRPHTAKRVILAVWRIRKGPNQEGPEPKAVCRGEFARGSEAYRLASGIGEDRLPSLRHIIQVHDHRGNALIAQLRVPPVLQPICVRLCTKQAEVMRSPDSWLTDCMKSASRVSDQGHSSITLTPAKVPGHQPTSRSGQAAESWRMPLLAC